MTPFNIVGPRRKRWWQIERPFEGWTNAICLGVFITLASPLWIPLWILLLPVRYQRERRKRKERLAQSALRASMPEPPQPPRDAELERRRELARQTNKHVHPKIRFLYDPIRDDPAIAKLIEEAGKRAHMEVSSGRYDHLGTCHPIWHRQKEILKQEHGIIWYSTREMNPGVIFD
jgi:hypothetical protein